MEDWCVIDSNLGVVWSRLAPKMAIGPSQPHTHRWAMKHSQFNGYINYVWPTSLVDQGQSMIISKENHPKKPIFINISGVYCTINKGLISRQCRPRIHHRLMTGGNTEVLGSGVVREKVTLQGWIGWEQNREFVLRSWWWGVNPAMVRIYWDEAGQLGLMVVFVNYSDAK
jgi:hypothetical protein